jgi:hypothetical protein
VPLYSLPHTCRSCESGRSNVPRRDDAPHGGAAGGVMRRSGRDTEGRPGTVSGRTPGADLARESRVALAPGGDRSCDQAR